MSADNTLEILIKTKADLNASKAILADLDKQIFKAKALGKSTADLEATQRRLNDSVQDYIRRNGDSQPEEKSISNKREIRRLLGELSTQFPILGDLGQVAFWGVAGAIGLAIKFVSEFYKQITELGNRSTPAFGRLTEAVEKQRDAMEEVEHAARSYDRALANLRNTNETVEANSQAYTERLKLKFDAEQRIADKTLSLQKTLVDSGEAYGIIGHQEALNRKLQIDLEYEKKKVAQENELARLQLVEKYRTAANLDIESKSLEQSVASKRVSVSQAAGKASFISDSVTNDKANLTATRSKIEELQKEQEDLKGFHPFESEIVLAAKIKANQQELDQQQAIEAQLKAAIEIDRKRRFVAEEQLRTSKESLEADEARLRADQEHLRDLRRELPRDEANTQLQTNTRNQESLIGQQTSAISTLAEVNTSGAKATGFDLNAIGATDALIRQGKPVTDAQAQQVKSFENYLDAQHINAQMMIALIRKGQDSTASIADKVAYLSKEYDILLQRLKDGLNR